MEVEVNDTPEGVVVRLRGEAGVPEAAALEAALLPVGTRRPARVTFELSELLSISSLAMGVLVAFRRAVVRAGGRVCLAPDLQPLVRQALHRAELLDLFEAVAAAVAGVEPGPSAADGRKPDPNGEVPPTARVTWGQLVDLEPRVEALLWRARAAGASCRTPTDVARAFSPVRNELAELIGFAGKHHRHPVLGSPGAYEVAYSKLHDDVAAFVAGRGLTC
jgi:anti-anti-sigma factor